MRFIDSGNPNTEIAVTDEPGAGGANHEYYVGPSQGLPRDPEKNYRPVGEYGHAKFQLGPIQENGVNGLHQEDLLSIVIDRLTSFQNGPFPCEENKRALHKCQEALMWLNCRTHNRAKRGAEGRLKA